jgi:uncharacterized membrane protein
LDIQTSKTLGGIGALLLVISPLTFVAGAFGGLLGLVGLILVLIAMKGLSDHYMEAGIFNNSLYGVIISIIGVVVFLAALFVTAISFFSDYLGVDLSTAFSDPTAFSSIDWVNILTFSDVMDFVTGIIISVVVLFIFAIIAAIFYRKSLTSLAERSGVGLFGTAGLLLLIGAVLTIIAIGFIIIWIALILLLVAFFQIKIEPAQPMKPS